MIRVKRRKCKNCHTFFLPDPRNAKRQKFCSRPECRKASKKESQRKWLNKQENKDYFQGPKNVLRVQQWRAEHPGYWRRNKTKTKIALQDPLNPQQAEINDDTRKFNGVALQDFLTVQPFVLLGLIANFTGTALQNDIDSTLRRLQQLGQDILLHSKLTPKKEVLMVPKNPILPQRVRRVPPRFKLGGPSLGP